MDIARGLHCLHKWVAVALSRGKGWRPGYLRRPGLLL